MYGVEYNCPEVEDASELAHYVQLHTVADKYQCLGLRELTAQT